MSKNKVGKEREGKEREGKEEFGLAFSHIRGGKLGRAIITKYCTRVKVGNIMTCAIFGVDISWDIDSCGGKILGFPIYFVFGPYNCSTNVLAVILQNSAGVLKTPSGRNEMTSEWHY